MTPDDVWCVATQPRRSSTNGRQQLDFAPARVWLRFRRACAKAGFDLTGPGDVGFETPPDRVREVDDAAEGVACARAALRRGRLAAEQGLWRRADRIADDGACRPTIPA